MQTVYLWLFHEIRTVHKAINGIVQTTVLWKYKPLRWLRDKRRTLTAWNWFMIISVVNDINQSIVP